MMTPLGWLERVPTYKDQQEKLENKDLSTYGFLGYPLLQSADILIYRADKVPVGEDQVPHIEFSRELARRFNHLYGREAGFADKAIEAVRKLGSKRARRYEELRRAYQQQGEQAAIERAHALARRGARSLARRPRAPLRLPRRDRQDDSCRARCTAHRSLAHARSRRPEDVEVLRQHDHPARRRRLGHAQAEAHADRPGADSPHGSRRPGQVPGLATASGVLGRELSGLGAGGLPQRRDRLPGVQAAGDRWHPARAGADARARSALSRRPETGARDHCRRQQQGAPPGRETMRDVRQAMGLDYH
jgi:tryptophanyl-tRNA synthetase